VAGSREAHGGPYADGVRDREDSGAISDATQAHSLGGSEVPESVLDQAAKGDEAAWSALWHDLLPGIRATARLLVSEDDVQDVVQDVAVAAWQSVASFRGESRLGTWVYRITVRRCLEVLKNGQRRLQVRQALAALQQPKRGGPAAARAAERYELARCLRQCFLSLHPTDRSALFLRHLRDLSYAEVAAALGCSEATARQRCQRARENLRTSFLQDAGETDNR